ncbi:MAG: non-heme iron oxygenase ferredoxin subunit [Sinimarinibacterium sp.]|jgi:3-phenylpropionate/trans-cinnamate dioxygenase ferredoxin subunit
MNTQGHSATSDCYTRVLKLSELAPGTKKVVEVGGKCVLVCNVNERLYAISNVCSHNEKPLERGRVGNGWIACPAHGARFDLATGAALNLPAKNPIATYPVQVVDDWIEVLVERAAAAS